MVIGNNIKKLIIAIAIVSLLLVMCMAVDSASNTVTDVNGSVNKVNNSNVLMINNTSYVVGNNNDSYFVAKSSDKIYVNKTKSKKKLPTISMWAKPSVRSRYSYTWYKFTWINYCPNCKHYNTLLKNPKCVPEREYTCSRCDSDFCAVTGKEKYSWSHVYLIKA